MRETGIRGHLARKRLKALKWAISPGVLGRLSRLRDKLHDSRVPGLHEVKTVLVLRPDGVGDIVLTSAFIRELRRNLPKARISLCVKPNTLNLVERCPYVDEILTFSASPRGDDRHAERIGSLLRLSRVLRERHLDLAILPRWGLDTHLASQLVCLSGARWRVTYSEHVCPAKEAENRGCDRFFTHVLSRQETRHEVESSLQILEFLGGKIKSRDPELWLGDDDWDWARSVLGDALAGKDRLLVGFGVGSAIPRKIWPIERYIELGTWLVRDYGALIVVVGGPGEEGEGRRLVEAVGTSVINLVGPCTLRQMGAVLRHCPIFVGNDTGPMHMAAAAGSRIAVISTHPRTGAANVGCSPVRFRPWGPGHIVLQPAQPAEGCSDACRAAVPHCILGVEVETVKRAIAEGLLNRSASNEDRPRAVH